MRRTRKARAGSPLPSRARLTNHRITMMTRKRRSRRVKGRNQTRSGKRKKLPTSIQMKMRKTMRNLANPRSPIRAPNTKIKKAMKNNPCLAKTTPVTNSPAMTPPLIWTTWRGASKKNSKKPLTLQIWPKPCTYFTFSNLKNRAHRTVIKDI